MKVKLYFMGSGKIAVPVIDKLYSSDKFELCGVCTQEDKFAGRNKVLTPTPVSMWAKKRNFKIIKVKSVNTESFINILKTLNLDIILVISFGQLLKQALLNIPKFGCINIHASLLPRYRGASPVISSIINGDDETGICFMRMERGLDAGPVFKEIHYKLSGTETADKLENELGELSANYLEEVLSGICTGKLTGTEQDSSKVSTASKIKKSDGLVEWKNKTAQQIERMVRAYNPWPGAYTYIMTSKGPKKIIITSALAFLSKLSIPGRVEKADKQAFEIGASEGTMLRIEKLIPEAKKEMPAEEFLRGTKVEIETECISI